MSRNLRIAVLGSFLLALTSGAVAEEEERSSTAKDVINKLKRWIPQISRLGQVEPERAATPESQTPPDSVAPQPYASPYGRQAVPSGNRKREVVRLNNAPANDVAKTLGDFYTREASAQGVNPSGPQPYYAPTAVAQVTIVPDTLSNSLIISAPAATLEEITKMVAQLDQKPEKVMIRLMIARVTQDAKDGERELDLSALPAPRAEGKNDRVSKTASLSASHDTVAALVARLGKTKGLELIAQPQIMTLSNQSAFLQIGERLPRLKESSSGKPHFDYENIGLTIGVTPRVDADDVVTMEIDVERSNVSPESKWIVVGVDAAGEPVRAPRIELTSAQTTVSASDQQAVVLAGLTAEDGEKTTQLLIVVTPQIVR